MIPINGLVPKRDFVMRAPVGEVITPVSDKTRNYSGIDYFLLMLPPENLRLVVTFTNRVQQK